jgi:4-diphosphocytidyl-2-C-methyl-D-erythritol kinase
VAAEVAPRVWQAAAKLNLTLEVLGRRPDGYHEIRSVVTLTTLHDQLLVEDGAGFAMLAAEDYDGSAIADGRDAYNSVEIALALIAAERFRLTADSTADLESALRIGLDHVSLKLTKRIPAAAGLGGGSSDAATALRALNVHWGLALDGARLARLALRIGSDCPLFLGGGTQLVGGRGEALKPLMPPRELNCCVINPHIIRAHKTQRAYGLLRERNFTSGEQSEALARKLRGPGSYGIQATDLFNVFDTVADEAFGDLGPFRRALLDAGASAVQLCGAGPALYGLFENGAHATAAADRLRAEGYSAVALAGRAE